MYVCVSYMGRWLCVVPCRCVSLALALEDVLWTGSKNVVNELQVVSPHLCEWEGRTFLVQTGALFLAKHNYLINLLRSKPSQFGREARSEGRGGEGRGRRGGREGSGEESSPAQPGNEANGREGGEKKGPEEGAA